MHQIQKQNPDYSLVKTGDLAKLVRAYEESRLQTWQRQNGVLEQQKHNRWAKTILTCCAGFSVLFVAGAFLADKLIPDPPEVNIYRTVQPTPSPAPAPGKLESCQSDCSNISVF